MTQNHLNTYLMISEREAKKMIWTFIRHGNHSRYHSMSKAPTGSIEKWFADQGEPLHKLIPRCRRYFDINVPFVENLIGSTWTLIADTNGNASASITQSNSASPPIQITGPGTIGVDYASKFEAACKARDRAIKDASLEDFHTAIVKGIASIESYITYRAEIWNLSSTAEFPLSDSSTGKVAFDRKIKNWVPTMTNGRALDLSGRMWQDFLYLRGIRDNDAIHAKRFAQGCSFADHALAINKFKIGIAELLLQLHILFEEPAPRSIIRARYFPEVHANTKTK